LRTTEKPSTTFKLHRNELGAPIPFKLWKDKGARFGLLDDFGRQKEYVK